MGIYRETAARIQKSSDLPQIIADSKRFLVEKVVPDAISSVHAQIKDRKAPGDGDLAARILEGAGVLGEAAAKPAFNFQADVRFQMLTALGPPPRAAQPPPIELEAPPQVESAPPEPPVAPSNGNGSAAQPCEPRNIITGRHDQWCHCRDCRPDLFA